MITLDLILADQLKKFKKEVDSLIAKNFMQDDAILQVLKRYIKESKKILFEGNNYSEEWIKEAKNRGLPNVTDTPHALKALISKQTIDLFENNNVLSKREMEARFEVQMENYIKKIQIESRVLGELAMNNIIPAAVKYINVLAGNISSLHQVFSATNAANVMKSQLDLVSEIAGHIGSVKTFVEQMTDARKTANGLHDSEEKALAYCKNVKPFFDKIRYHADKLELLVDDNLWPLPKYREMLFIH
jgi:glutamine synthetase